jgi:hypothetical protein
MRLSVPKKNEIIKLSGKKLFQPKLEIIKMLKEDETKYPKNLTLFKPKTLRRSKLLSPKPTEPTQVGFSIHWNSLSIELFPIITPSLLFIIGTILLFHI